MIVALMNRLSHRYILKFGMITSCAFLLGSLMNVGAVRIMDDLFGQGFEDNKPTFIKAVTRGFSLSAMFSPYIAGIAIILYLLHVSLLTFLLYGAMIVTIGLAHSIGLSYIEMKGKSFQYSERQKKLDSAVQIKPNQFAKKSWQLVFAFLGLFTSIILLNKSFSINLVIIISLVGFVYPFFWVFCIRKPKALPSELHHYKNHLLPNVHNESVMVVTATFFAKMVQLTPFLNYISSGLIKVTHLSIILTILLILSIVTLCAIMGVHQILPVTMFATAFAKGTITMPPDLLAIVLAVAWGMAGLTGPIAALTIVSTQLFHVTWKQLLVWNWKFTILMLLSTTLFIYLMTFFYQAH